MAGKVLFEEGPHPSRSGFRGEITGADWNKLRAASPPYVPDEALAELTNKIMFAEADSKRGASYVPLRDQLAQLKKLKRLAKRDKGRAFVDADGREHCFVELAGALANLDQDTLERIKAADRAAIEAIIDKNGVFIDADRREHRFAPPSTEVVRPFTRQHVVFSDHPACRGIKAAPCSPGSVWFPRGIEGFKEALAAAINELETQRDAVGRREKPWQDALARGVVDFWQAHCSTEAQGANHKSGTGWSSPMVNFADVVFLVAGESFSRESKPLSKVRLARLLHAQQEK